MSTNTTRLQLTKPDPSDSMAIGDLVIGHNYNLLDKYTGAPTYTSATRPGSPYQGMLIWESDTDNFRMWSGAKWIYAGNKDASRGAIAKEQNTAGLTLPRNTETKWRSLTFNAIQNRKLLINYSLTAEYTTNLNGNVGVVMRWAPGSSVSSGDTLFSHDVFKVNSTGVSASGFRNAVNFDYTAVSQQITIGFFLKEENNVGIVGLGFSEGGFDEGLYWTVMDWGKV